MKKRILLSLLIAALISCAALAEEIELDFEGMIYDVPLDGQREMRMVDAAMLTRKGTGEWYMGLYDADRSIYVHETINENYLLFREKAAGVSFCAWPVEEDGSRYADGIDALAGIQLAYDYYAGQFGWHAPTGDGDCFIKLYTGVDFLEGGDSSSRGNALTSWEYGEENWVQITMGRDSDEDAQSVSEHVMVHEYTHAVLAAKGVEAAEGHQSRAVHEGYCDVMAICAVKDGWVYRMASDSRNLADPEASSCLSDYGDIPAWGSVEHEMGTILGHAAYLMYQGRAVILGPLVRHEGAIDDYDRMAELFYRSMDKLGNRPTMQDAAEAIADAAVGLCEDGRLTINQVRSVYSALDMVGLGCEQPLETLNFNERGMALTLKDRNGELFTDYRIDIYTPNQVIGEEPALSMEAEDEIEYIDLDRSFDGGLIVLTDRYDAEKSVRYLLNASFKDEYRQHTLDTPFENIDWVAPINPAQQPSVRSSELEVFYEEELLPRFGHAAEGECDAAGLEGILTHTVCDLDGDGGEELLVVRGEWLDGMYWLNMEVYEEEGGGAVSAGGLAYMTDMIGTDWYDVRAAFGLLEHQGETYIVLYNYFSMNDNSESFLIYRYEEKEGIHRVDGSCIWTYWNGAQLLGNTGRYVERDAEPIFMYGMFDQDWEEVYAGYSQDDDASGSDRFRAEAVKLYKEALAGWGMERPGDKLLYSDDDYESREKLTADELIFGEGLRWLGTLTSAPGWDNAAGAAFTLIGARDLSD